LAPGFRLEQHAHFSSVSLFDAKQTSQFHLLLLVNREAKEGADVVKLVSGLLVKKPPLVEMLIAGDLVGVVTDGLVGFKNDAVAYSVDFTD